MKKFLFFTIVSILCITVNGQFIDKYGIRVGGGSSNQFWRYKSDMFSGLNGWKDEKIGIAAYLNAEKQLSNYFSIRQELGYIQKGFSENMLIADENGSELGEYDDYVMLHNVSVDLVLKISPVDYTLKPYLIVGMRGDFMIQYKDLMYEIDGETYGVHKSTLDEFRRFSLGGLIGVGFEFKNLLYLEYEYNPSISNNLNNDWISIKSRYNGITLGFNINELISSK